MSAKKKPTTDVARTTHTDEPQALTEAELKEVHQKVRPGVGKMMGVSLLMGALGGGALAGGVGAAIDAPQRADFEVANTAEMEITSTFSTEVHNPEGVLSADDEARLERDAERIDAPAVVEQLHYMVFEENDDNVNDTVEEYLRDNRPDLIGDDYFADGVLIVGVGLDPVRPSFLLAKM